MAIGEPPESLLSRIGIDRETTPDGQLLLRRPLDKLGQVTTRLSQSQNEISWCEGGD